MCGTGWEARAGTMVDLIQNGLKESID